MKEMANFFIDIRVASVSVQGFPGESYAGTVGVDNFQAGRTLIEIGNNAVGHNKYFVSDEGEILMQMIIIRK